MSRVFPSALTLCALALGGCQLIDGIDGKTFVEAGGAAGTGGNTPVGGQGGAGSGGIAGASGVSQGGAGTSGGSAGSTAGSAGTVGGGAGAGNAGENAGGTSAGASGSAGSAGGGVTRPSWALHLGASDLYEVIREVRVTAGGIYALGVSSINVGGGDSAFLARFSLDGDLLWAKNYRQYGFNDLSRMEIVNDTVVVTGSTADSGQPSHIWLLGLSPQDGSVKWQLLNDTTPSGALSVWGLAPRLDGLGVMVGINRGLEWKGLQPVATSIAPTVTVFPETGAFFTAVVQVNVSIFPERLSVFGNRYLYSGSYQDDAAAIPLGSNGTATNGIDLLPASDGSIFGDALPLSFLTTAGWLSYGATRLVKDGPFKLYVTQISDKSPAPGWTYALDLGVDYTSVRAVEVTSGVVLVATRDEGMAPTPVLVKIDKKGAIEWSKTLSDRFVVSAIAAVPGTDGVVLGGKTCDASISGCETLAGDAALVRVAADGTIADYTKVAPITLSQLTFKPLLNMGHNPSPYQVFTQGAPEDRKIFLQAGTMTPTDWKPPVAFITE